MAWPMFDITVCWRHLASGLTIYSLYIHCICVVFVFVFLESIVSHSLCKSHNFELNTNIYLLKL